MARKTRGRPSSIARLPEDLREEIGRLLAGGMTQSEILEAIRPAVAQAGSSPVSRSALNRHATRMEEMAHRIRRDREIARAWRSQLEGEPGELSDLIVEVLRTMAYEAALHQAEGEDDDGRKTVDVALLKDLALTVQRLERAGIASAQREAQLRRVWAERAAAKAAEAAAEQAKRAGVVLQEEALHAIRRDVYGIHDVPADG